MEKLKICSLGYAMCVLTFSLFLSSCVNPEYDMEKVKMDEATFMENISMPVGDVEKLTIEKVLFSKSGMPDAVRKDENGDLHLDLFSDSYETSFSVSNGFYLNHMEFEGVYVDLNMGALAGVSTSGLPEQTITFSSLNGSKPFTVLQPVIIDQSLPSNILDIKDVGLDAVLNCHFSIGGLPVEHIAPITVKKGLEIRFPENIFISKGSGSVDYSVINGHVIRFDSDTRIMPDDMLQMSVVFTHISVPEGAVVTRNGKRYITFADDVSVSGDFSFNTKDIAVIPEMLRLMFWINIPGIPVKYAEVSLDANMNIPDQEMNIAEIPDMFKGENICADLYNPQMSVKVANSTPLPFTMSTDIMTYGASGSPVTLSLSAADGLNIPAGQTSEYLISRRQTQVPSGTVNIVKPVIGDMISSIPERLALRNCNIAVPSDFVTVNVGKVYKAAVDYSVSSPLAFGENLALTFTQDIENLGLSLDMNVKSVIFEMDLVNSIPVDFGLSATCIDNDGNVVSGAQVSLDKEIKAGSHITPVTTPLKLEIKNTDDKLNIDALRLTMTATAPEAAYVGVPLNENQGFEIKNIVMTLPDGIGVKFN